MNHEPTLAQVGDLWATLTGEPSHPIQSDFEALRHALIHEQQAILAEIPWLEQTPTGLITTQQLLLHHITADRIHFSHPQPRSHDVPGTTVSGEGCGPERIVHPDGTQSMELSLFARLFILGGGQALLSTPPLVEHT
jgi:hypothetical protein